MSPAVFEARRMLNIALKCSKSGKWREEFLCNKWLRT
jgi:hypothetical protein